MLIIVTDEGRVWNHNTPVLEQYADCVLVVCLNGKPVTDKYRCFVSPYNEFHGVGMLDESITGEKYRALASVANELRHTFSYHDDIVFLTDEEPTSLLPFLVLKDMHTYNYFHLWCMLPMRFEGRRRRSLYAGLLEDFKSAHSIICFDDNFLDLLPKKSKTFARIFDAINEYAWGLLPTVLCDIGTKMHFDSKYFFDFGVKRYIEIDNSYDALIQADPIHSKEIEDFHPHQMFSTLGLLVCDDFPDESPYTKKAIEQLHPRPNGKDICNQLKMMRQKLAEANGIDFHTVDCPSTGPCAGTCPQCDKELTELAERLSLINPDQRIYPEVMVENFHSGFGPMPLPKESSDDDEPVFTMGIFKFNDRSERNE